MEAGVDASAWRRIEPSGARTIRRADETWTTCSPETSVSGVVRRSTAAVARTLVELESVDTGATVR
jgi:hypothetical protein